jgi:hypothetical protein
MERIKVGPDGWKMRKVGSSRVTISVWYLGRLTGVAPCYASAVRRRRISATNLFTAITGTYAESAVEYSPLTNTWCGAVPSLSRVPATDCDTTGNAARANIGVFELESTSMAVAQEGLACA